MWDYTAYVVAVVDLVFEVIWIVQHVQLIRHEESQSREVEVMDGALRARAKNRACIKDSLRYALMSGSSSNLYFLFSQGNHCFF